MKKDVFKPILSEVRKPREAGILMPVFSLDSEYGIGDLGPAAYRFTDALHSAGQKLWQILPMNSTGYGDSPYQCLSGFAGNPYMISPEILIDKGWLKKNEADSYDFGNGKKINYGKLFANRMKMLKIAYSRWKKSSSENEYLNEVKSQNEYWLTNYALFSALKAYNGGRSWIQWENTPDNAEELNAEIQFQIYCQYEFFSQWQALRQYANQNSVRIIGDMPFYVSADSADVWGRRNEFLVSEDGVTQKFLAGVPADSIADKDRCWGNMIYNWDTMEADGFSWWRERAKLFSRMYDIIRVDHVIAFVRYYAISSDSSEGNWYIGPDAENAKVSAILTEEANKTDTEIIAEDLGSVNDRVRSLIIELNWHCTRVLHYSFNNKYGARNSHITYNHPQLSAVYTGTHDNQTTVDYVRSKTDEQLQFIMNYLKLTDRRKLPWALIEEAYRSPGIKAIIPMQDILGLDDNTRNVYQNNNDKSWKWRINHGQFNEELQCKLRSMAETCGRL